MEEDIIVTMTDVRSANYCARAARVWFAQHGLSWDVFLENGYPVSVLMEIGDPIVLAVVEQAKKRVAG